MMTTFFISIFRLLFHDFYINHQIIIDKGFELVKNIVVLIVTWTIFFYALYWYVYTLYFMASIAVTMLAISLSVIAFVKRIIFMKNNPSTFTNNKFAFIFFKIDWANMLLAGVAKVSAILFISWRIGNFYYIDLNILFIIIAAVFAVLFIMTSEFVVNILFKIQQASIEVIKIFEDWAGDFNKADSATKNHR